MLRLFAFALLFALPLLFATVPAIAEDDDAAAEASEGEGEGEGLTGNRPGFLQVKEISLPVFGDQSVDMIYEIDIAIEVVSPKAAIDARRIEPRVRDAVYTSLYGRMERGQALDRAGLLDIRRVREAAMEATVAVLGEDVVTNVLIEKMDRFRAF